MTLKPGTQLGPYEIISAIGAGGMGEVYRARDPRVGREVAIKVSTEKFSERFEREARAVAALNHSNICTLYDVGPDYLVMELIEGETLADRIQKGAIPLEESLAIGRQIADALEAAHEKGIIHRDLKPSNIKIRPDGTVKVLDFGLAKVTETQDTSLSHSPTLSHLATQQGIILGTAAYMSPEQARGKAVDKRADVWAFGCVLFEMLTGQAAFQGEDVSAILAAVIRAEPDWSALPANLHWRVREMPERCLTKDARNRYGSISDARVDIQKALNDPGQVLPQAAAFKQEKMPRVALPWVAAAVALCAIICGLAVWRLKPDKPRRYLPTGHIVYALGGNLFAIRFDVKALKVVGGPVSLVEGVLRSGGAPQYAVSDSGTLVYIPGTASTIAAGRTLVWVDRSGKEEPITAEPHNYINPRISPDGTTVVLSFQTGSFADIWTWDLVRKNLTRLTFGPTTNALPLWTRDGKRIVFASNRQGTPKVYWKAADGTGKDELLFSVPNVGLLPASWSSDGKNLVLTERVGPNLDIGMVSMGGDRKHRALLHDGKYSESQPRVSPNGRWIAYTSDESGQPQVYVRPFPDVDSGRWQVSTGGGDSPLWSRDGRELFYHSGDTIMVVPVKTESTFSLETPRILFKETCYFPDPGTFFQTASNQYTWDISRDGKHFLMIKPPGAITASDGGPRKINVVLNWLDELKQRVPSGSK